MRRMPWDFETEPEFQEELDWIEQFTREEVEPLDHVVWHAWDIQDPVRRTLIPPLQDAVRARNLWACHLGPELGGQGAGQVRLALINEIIGRTHCGPIVFGCQAPDSGNAEILAHYGSPYLKERYLAPLLENKIVSAFSMTEPYGGSDPTNFTSFAVLDGDEWVINGEKWYTSHARFASFLIVVVVTEPDAEAHRRASTIVVPADTPGIEIVRNVGNQGNSDEDATHAYVRYNNVRVPRDNLLGDRGGGFVVAQTRLGGGRIHHAMRTVGLVRNAFDALCERALSRRSKGDLLADKQLVQEMIADSWIKIEQFRLLVLRTAWKIDKYNDYKQVRADISAVKIAMPQVLRDVAANALQIHGSLGQSNEMPFGAMITESYTKGLADGPTEIHKVTLARQLLRAYRPLEDVFPSTHLPRLRAAAEEKFADALAGVPAQQRRRPATSSVYR
jgi:acyl-CoA dehydrogenase